MTDRLSPKKKRLMVQLIITCQIHDLTEKESLSFISRKLGRSISRRYYYQYRKALYDLEILKKTGHSFPNWSLLGRKRLFPEKTYLNTDNDLSRKYSNLIELDFIPDKIYKVISDGYKNINRYRNSFDRCNNLKQTSRLNYELIPKKATIRKEYIKCGNFYCRRCKHGPYYYAYWRDQDKRFKKYLGKYDPRNKEALKLTDLTPFMSS